MKTSCRTTCTSEAVCLRWSATASHVATSCAATSGGGMQTFDCKVCMSETARLNACRAVLSCAAPSGRRGKIFDRTRCMSEAARLSRSARADDCPAQRHSPVDCLHEGAALHHLSLSCRNDALTGRRCSDCPVPACWSRHLRVFSGGSSRGLAGRSSCSRLCRQKASCCKCGPACG